MTTQNATLDDRPEVATPGGSEPSRPKSKDAVLGDQVVVLKRLGTRDGLVVAQKVLTYIGDLQEPLLAAYKRFESLQVEQKEGGQEDTDRTGDYLTVGMEMIEAVMRVLGDDDLLKVLSRLLGQPVDVVGDAPLEDVLGAVADALSINDMPALLKAANGIWEEVQKMGARL